MGKRQYNPTVARPGYSHRPTGAAPAVTSAAPVPAHSLASLAALHKELEEQSLGLARSLAAAGTTLAMIERSLADIDRHLMDVVEAQHALLEEPRHEH
ncbi:MAG: hypothetical protein NVSMB32_17110 [Actinomycetota bacterium]